MSYGQYNEINVNQSIIYAFLKFCKIQNLFRGELSISTGKHENYFNRGAVFVFLT